MPETVVNETVETGRKTGSTCFQAGYLPVPLEVVPPEGLSGLKIFLSTPPTFNLYKNTDLGFSEKDRDRLIKGGVYYVYISTYDHQAYYNAIEKSLDSILDNKNIVIEKKGEILYSTTLALASQLMVPEPGQGELDKTRRLTESTIKFVMSNPRAFGHLFDISNHDFYTATHMANVSTMLIAFGDKIGIKDTAILNALGTGGLLHDIGKIFIPRDLLNCKEKLTPGQITVIQSHVARGVEHLQKIAELPPSIINIVAEHHERLDGSGYPRGLAGDGISIMGRMAGLVDVFEAMISVRPYRNHCLSVDEALGIIHDMTPRHFDRSIVDSFDQFVQTSMNGAEPAGDNQCNEYILRELGINSDPANNRSGRAYSRFYFRVRSILRRLERQNGKWVTGPEERVVAHNISQGGIGLLSVQKIKTGETIQIVITSPHSPKKLVYLGTVVRCENHGDGWFTIGVRFLKVLPASEVQDAYKALH